MSTKSPEEQIFELASETLGEHGGSVHCLSVGNGSAKAWFTLSAEGDDAMLYYLEDGDTSFSTTYLTKRDLESILTTMCHHESRCKTTKEVDT